MESPYHTAQELVESVRTLLTLPEVYTRVKDVVEDPDSCLSDLVNAITIDPGITARLLRLVNSAYFNVGTQVGDIRQAVNIMGMRAVHDLVLATTLNSTFSGTQASSFDMRSFWVNSVHRAVYSHQLAKQCGISDHQRLFIGGLLSDIGHQVMHMRIPELAQQAGILAARSENPLDIEELKVIGYSYAAVGGELLKLWKMPANIFEAVHYHTQPGLANAFPLDTSIVHIASALTSLNDSRIESTEIYKFVHSEALELTGLTIEEILIMREQADLKIDEAINLLVPYKAAS